MKDLAGMRLEVVCVEGRGGSIWRGGGWGKGNR